MNDSGVEQQMAADQGKGVGPIGDAPTRGCDDGWVWNDATRTDQPCQCQSVVGRFKPESWWVINEAVLWGAIHEAANGKDPDRIWVELLAGAQVERHGDDSPALTLVPRQEEE